MYLKTNRLTIRPVEESDWESLAEIWRDFSASEFAQYDAPHPTGASAAREQARRWAASSPEKAHMYFAVCLDTVVIGDLIFHKVDDGYDCGYCFHSRYHGNGYARESLTAALKWLSEDHEMRFFAGTALNNTPSVRLLESVGFEKIGEEQVSFYEDADGNDIWFTGGVYLYETPERSFA